ncbi:hypothetical protein C0J52_02631 [Blattella germanica]|nr:hypothetical protein C0J52_02631 [Blattella germanica]
MLASRYSGHFCECDNFTCMRYRDALCSGPEHGTCVCGECDCLPGWSGEACECPLNKQSCYQPGTNLECSGRGHCECGECKCVESGGVPFTGKYCQECPVIPKPASRSNAPSTATWSIAPCSSRVLSSTSAPRNLISKCKQWILSKSQRDLTIPFASAGRRTRTTATSFSGMKWTGHLWRCSAPKCAPSKLTFWTGNPLYQNPVIKYTNPTFRD